MNYLDLIKCIDKKQLNNIILLHDRESYLTELAEESMKKDLLDQSFLDLNFQSFNFEKLDKATYISAIETLPFMDSWKIVWIKNLTLQKEKIKKFEGTLSFIQDSFKDFNKSTLLVLVYSGDAIYKTGKFYKALEKAGQVFTIDRLDRRQFQSFIIKHFAKNRIKLDSRKADYIADRLGYLAKDSKIGLYEVTNELDKLANNIKSQNPSFEEIEETVLEHFQDNIFMLTDALSTRDIKKALTLYERMDDDRFMVFHMLLRQVKNLICIKDCNQRRMNKATGMKYCSVGPYEYDKGTTFSRNFTMDQLLDLHKLCFEAEKKVKTSGGDIDYLVKRIILDFAKK